jgi:hypothetical protein
MDTKTNYSNSFFKKTVLSRAFSRRNFLRLAVVGGLSLPVIGQILSRQWRRNSIFRFGFNRLPEDLQWSEERSFNDALLNRPKSLSFFELDSFFVFFPTSVCLNFFAYKLDNLSKFLEIEGKLILDGDEVVEGPAICYPASSDRKPIRASAPLGITTPLILPTPYEYNIFFRSGFDLVSLKRVEWIVSIFD